MKSILLIVICLLFVGCSNDTGNKMVPLIYELSQTSIELGYKCKEQNISLDVCKDTNTKQFIKALDK